MRLTDDCRSDFVYMVPPFLAYYGVTTRNRTMLAESYNQIRLYRNYLRDSKQGMWKHIVLGPSGNDEGFWSTGGQLLVTHRLPTTLTLLFLGNGWAAAGILRVIATMRQSEYSNTFKNEQKDLGNWVKEIHSSMYKHLVRPYLRVLPSIHLIQLSPSRTKRTYSQTTPTNPQQAKATFTTQHPPHSSPAQSTAPPSSSANTPTSPTPSARGSQYQTPPTPLQMAMGRQASTIIRILRRTGG